MSNTEILNGIKQALNYNGELNTCKMWVKAGRFVNKEAAPMATATLWVRVGTTKTDKGEKPRYKQMLAHLFGQEQTELIPEKNLQTN